MQISFLQWKNPDIIFIRNVYSLLNSLGEHVNSYEYEDIQEKVVHKHRDDHRLQTVLNLFDMYGVTEGTIEAKNLKLIGEVPDDLLDEQFVRSKMERDRQRLIDIVNYAKSSDCRRETIYRYFGMGLSECGNCDNCRTGGTL